MSAESQTSKTSIDNVIMAMLTYTTIEEMLEALFTVQSVSGIYKEQQPPL
jgi:hypothetical protein